MFGLLNKEQVNLLDRLTRKSKTWFHLRLRKKKRIEPQEKKVGPQWPPTSWHCQLALLAMGASLKCVGIVQCIKAERQALVPIAASLLFTSLFIWRERKKKRDRLANTVRSRTREQKYFSSISLARAHLHNKIHVSLQNRL